MQTLFIQGKIKQQCILITLLIGFCAPIPHWANNIIDVYGAKDSQESKLLMDRYGKQIAELVEMMNEENLHPSTNEQIFLEKKAKKIALQKQIQRHFGFLSVDFAPVTYQGDKNTYTTVEIVQSNQPDRLKFINKETSIQPRKHTQDIIDKMIEYESLSQQLFMSQQLKSNFLCPVFHCIAGFEHIRLKPYLEIFNQSAIKDKQFIVTTIKYDPDPNRRAAALFLLGHFKEPVEIINLSSSSLQDSSELVRNNAMRVMILTMGKSNLDKIDLMPAIKLLDSPITTDRNKALYILLAAIKSKTNQKIILQHAGHKLLQLLALKQPNNHDPAYLILKSLSHHDFGAEPNLHWKNWLDKHVVA